MTPETLNPSIQNSTHEQIHDRELISIEEAAVIKGISRASLYRLIKNRGIETHSTAPDRRKKLIYKDEIDSTPILKTAKSRFFIADRTTIPTSTNPMFRNILQTFIGWASSQPEPKQLEIASTLLKIYSDNIHSQPFSISQTPFSS